MADSLRHRASRRPRGARPRGLRSALPQLTRTAAGYEIQFATSHLGHFAPATGLHESLAAASGARVVSLASIGHLFSPVVFDDLHYRFRPYDQWTSYGQSKSANVLFAVGAARRWADDGIAVNALMPGNVASTPLARHMGADDLDRFGETTALALPPVKTIGQELPRRSYSQPAPTSKGSRADTTKIAPRRHLSVNLACTPEVSPPMHLTRTTRTGSGRSRTS